MPISRRHALLLTTLLPLTGRATIPLPLPLAKVIEIAKVVALVRIVSGQLTHSSTQECGAKYSGTVLRVYKGDPTAQTLEFGPYFGLKIGKHYLVFLAGGSLAPENYGSTNSIEQSSRANFLQACTMVAAPLSILSFGRGAMPVEDALGPPDQWLIDWQPLIEPPSGMKLHTSRRSDDQRVSVAEFERVLRLPK